MSGVQYITGSPVTLGKNVTGTATATCPAGLQVISGGFTTTIPAGSVHSPGDMQVFSSVFSGMTGWSVTATNNNSSNSGSLTLTAYAVCAVVQ